MLHHLANLLSHYGYVIVALFMVAEGCGIPVPAETMLVTAAAFAAQGRLSIFGVMLAAAIGGVIGGTAGYVIGAKGGLPLLKRYGQHVGVDDAKLARAQAFFHRRGGSAAFLGRFVAFLRMIVPMLAGVAHMPFARFSIYNSAGACVAALAYGFLGYRFGRNLPALEHHLTRVSLVLIAVVLIGYLVTKWRSNRPLRSTPDEDYSR